MVFLPNPPVAPTVSRHNVTTRQCVFPGSSPVASLLLAVVLASGGVLAGTDVAAAAVVQQPTPSAASPQGAAPDGFVPVSQLPQQEQLPAAPLLIGAYSFVWLMLLGYIWSIRRRLSSVEREMRSLAQQVEARRRE